MWPYCEKRCSYCNFNKYIPRGVEEGTVRNCLVTEARTLLRLSGVQRVESVFFGGGTPSLASPHTVAAVLEAVAQEVYLPADSEVTLEANPTSAPGPRLAAFGAAGVNSPWMTRSCSCWAGLTQPATLYGLWRKPGSFSLAECRWI